MSVPITYTVLAADGQQYGPYPADNVQAWINEGRIKADQQMTRSDLKDWFRAGDFSEFAWPATSAAPQPVPAMAAAPVTRAAGNGPRTLASIDPGLVGAMRKHANWFWIIAIIGLIYDVIGLGVGAGSSILPYLFADLSFAVVGYFAYRAHRWAFVLGLLMLVGSLVFQIQQERWIMVAVRCWAIYEVFVAFRMAINIQKRLREG